MMLYKKLIGIFIVGAAIYGNASIETSVRSIPAPSAIDLPPPNYVTGIKIVPLSESTYSQATKTYALSTKEKQEKLGYVLQENEEQANFLLNINARAKQEIDTYKSTTNPSDTHLKKTLSEINLAIPFGGIKAIPEKDMIAYAPIGGYEKINGKTEGWTGAIAFFNSPIGVCAYSFQKIVGVEIVKELTDFFVNGNPSNKIVEGNTKDGFVYTVEWYKADKNVKNSAFIARLECANKAFDKTRLNNVIKLARSVDDQQR